MVLPLRTAELLNFGTVDIWAVQFYHYIWQWGLFCAFQEAQQNAWFLPTRGQQLLLPPLSQVLTAPHVSGQPLSNGELLAYRKKELLSVPVEALSQCLRSLDRRTSGPALQKATKNYPIHALSKSQIICRHCELRQQVK